MGTNDYYDDRKYCTSCDDYVPYLASVEHSYCVQCGAQVRLFSSEDWQRFKSGLETKKRPRHKTKATGKAKAISDAQAQSAVEDSDNGNPSEQQRESA